MFIVEMSENHGYSYAFYCWRKSSKMKYIKVGSLLVLCWQTFFDPENRKSDSLRGSPISTNSALWNVELVFSAEKNITVLHRQDHKLSSEVHLPCGILKQTKRLLFSEAGS